MAETAFFLLGAKPGLSSGYGHLPKYLSLYNKPVLEEGERATSKVQDQEVHFQIYCHYFP